MCSMTVTCPNMVVRPMLLLKLNTHATILRSSGSILREHWTGSNPATFHSNVFLYTMNLNQNSFFCGLILFLDFLSSLYHLLLRRKLWTVRYWQQTLVCSTLSRLTTARSSLSLSLDYAHQNCCHLNNYVASEFNQVLQSDSCRLYQLQSHTCSQGHPLNRFTWGMFVIWQSSF